MFLFCRWLGHEGSDIGRWIWHSLAATYAKSAKATCRVCQQANDDASDRSPCQGNVFLCHVSLLFCVQLQRWQSIVMNTSVCLSARISLDPHAWSLPIFLCMLPMAVVWSSGRVMKSQREGAVLGVFLPTDSALYSITFGTYTKMAEPIAMPFGMMTRVGCRYMC